MSATEFSEGGRDSINDGAELIDGVITEGVELEDGGPSGLDVEVGILVGNSLVDEGVEGVVLDVGKLLEVGLVSAPNSVGEKVVLLGCALELGKESSVGATEGSEHHVGTITQRLGLVPVGAFAADGTALELGTGSTLMLGRLDALGTKEGAALTEGSRPPLVPKLGNNEGILVATLLGKELCEGLADCVGTTEGPKLALGGLEALGWKEGREVKEGLMLSLPFMLGGCDGPLDGMLLGKKLCEGLADCVGTTEGTKLALGGLEILGLNVGRSLPKDGLILEVGPDV